MQFTLTAKFYFTKGDPTTVRWVEDSRFKKRDSEGNESEIEMGLEDIKLYFNDRFRKAMKNKDAMAIPGVGGPSTIISFENVLYVSLNISESERTGRL